MRRVRARYDAAEAVLPEDAEYSYESIMTMDLIILTRSTGLLFSYAILEFHAPLLLRFDGVTIGKRTL